MHTLTLVIPDVFTPFRLKIHDMSEMPSLDALSYLVSKAQPLPHTARNVPDLYFNLFDINPAQLSRLPIAALTYLADCNQHSSDWLLRMDPVHLQVDRDHLVLADKHVLDITDDEADAFIQLINSNYPDMPWQVVKGHASRWYIELKQSPEIKTHALNEVNGKSINTYLITGKDKRHWQAMMNEIQMLMHSHAINQRRMSNGQLPVNSVWFWGEGRLSDLDSLPETSHWDIVYSNECVSQGLAQYHNIKVFDVPAGFSDIRLDEGSDGQVMVILDELHSHVKYEDIDRWQDGLQGIETNWAKPIVDALLSGTVSQLQLLDGQGYRYLVTPKLLRRWWKRKRSLQQCFC